MKSNRPFVAFALASPVLASLGCRPAEAPNVSSEKVFEMSAPSVVAILNDTRAEEARQLELWKRAALENSKAPQKVIDVSREKDPQPHGTGFVIATPSGIRVVTAAHVIHRPDKLRVTTRFGQSTEAELERLDEVRDIAVLRPKEPLKQVTPIAVGTKPPAVGQPVWAMGHTGRGYWSLSWGMSAGIASGVTEMHGAKFLLFDAAIYPGFSGGPVVTLENGVPHVVGVNHAILFAPRTGSVYSASAVEEIQAVVRGEQPAIHKDLVAFRDQYRGKRYADVFVSSGVTVRRDEDGNQTALWQGPSTDVEVTCGRAQIPTVAMLYNLGKGDHDLVFELLDPKGTVLATEKTKVRVKRKIDRVAFASAKLDVRKIEASGRYSIVLKEGGKAIGSSAVVLQHDDDDDQVVGQEFAGRLDGGDPTVDLVVGWSQRGFWGAGGDVIGTTWAERAYPRRSEYTFIARGSRGWSGEGVNVDAYVMDAAGNIVGHSVGCQFDKIIPERDWVCRGSGGNPLLSKEGQHDVVITLNKRPVAWWPMEATIKQAHTYGSDLERYQMEIRRRTEVVKHKREGRCGRE